MFSAAENSATLFVLNIILHIHPSRNNPKIFSKDLTYDGRWYVIEDGMGKYNTIDLSNKL